MTSSENPRAKHSKYYSAENLSRAVKPRNIKHWQMFEYQYEYPVGDGETETASEVHIRLPCRTGSIMKTLRLLDDDTWEFRYFNFTLEDELEYDDFRIIKGKQLRVSIQDGVMGFRILDAEK